MPDRFVVHARNKRNKLAMELCPWPGTEFHIVSDPVTRDQAEVVMDDWQVAVESGGWEFWIEETHHAE